nr:type VI secretion system baseplate subunit TssG [Methylobacterium nodulans]
MSPALAARPGAHDLFALLRRLEREHPDRPRIGDSAARREEYVALGEDPFLDFPASTLSRVDRDADGRLRLFVRFLGLLGPQGALPLAVTDEAHGWHLAHDDAFPRFLDILNNRFLQLFFRAWADARPAAQADRPDQDRFVAYVGSAIGLGSAPYRNRGAVPDSAKLAFAGLLAPKAKSPARLRAAVAGLFGVAVEIDSFVGTQLAFEPGDRSRLGRAHARLGADLLLGSRVFSVEDRFRIRIIAADLAQYERFLPTGESCALLADLVFFHLGEELDWELELALPAHAVRPARLGRGGRLGYTAWITRPPDPDAPGLRRDARLNPAERIRVLEAHPNPHRTDRRPS